MIISKTPFRISFFGGGTDYPGWYMKNGGKVLSTTFDKYCYVTCRELPPFFDHKYRIAYSRIENIKSINEIEHPAVRGVLKEMAFAYGLEIHVDADLPARSGLGSSSTFLVGLLNSLQALRGIRVSKEELSKEAIRFEQEVLCENVGSQDQVAAAHGGFNIIHFQTDGNIRVEPLVINEAKKNELNSYLMLFFTGFSRIASNIAKSKVANLNKKSNELNSMRQMVDEAVEILCNGKSVEDFGKLLHATWEYKRTLSDKVSNPEIDSIYEKARKAGALGGKLLGAGGGGFMLLFVEPEKQAIVRDALKNLIYVPFKFENTGSQIIHYQP